MRVAARWALRPSCMRHCTPGWPTCSGDTSERLRRQRQGVCREARPDRTTNPEDDSSHGLQVTASPRFGGRGTAFRSEPAHPLALALGNPAGHVPPAEVNIDQRQAGAVEIHALLKAPVGYRAGPTQRLVHFDGPSPARRVGVPQVPPLEVALAGQNTQAKRGTSWGIDRPFRYATQSPRFISRSNSGNRAEAHGCPRVQVARM